MKKKLLLSNYSKMYYIPRKSKMKHSVHKINNEYNLYISLPAVAAKYCLMTPLLTILYI